MSGLCAVLPYCYDLSGSSLVILLRLFLSFVVHHFLFSCAAVRTILLEQGSKYEPPSTHNIDNPETIQSSYRANFISYNDVNDVSGLGCEEPPCMVAARVEGPLPFRAEPKADRTYNFKPMMISREEGKPPKEIQAYWH